MDQRMLHNGFSTLRLRTSAVFLAILLCWAPASSGAPPGTKETVARQVYSRIIKAIGDARPAPTLQFVCDSAGQANRVAWFDPTTKTIALEERAYDICSHAGPDSLNALAFLLGHELAHYYKDHAWGGDFGSGNADLSSGRTIGKASGTLDEMLTLETQADEFGAFFGHLAGYHTLAIAPALLPAIYEGFHLSQRLNGYPSLTERVTIANRSAERLESLIPLFESAERLLVIGGYRQAGVLFDEVARVFPSREVLANAGIARALEATTLLDPHQWPWIFPFEIDGTTRLQTRPSRGETDDARTQRIVHLLEKARALLEQARDRDPEYTPVLSNLSLVCLLGGDDAFALAFAAKAVTMARTVGNTNDLVAALQARAIAAEHSGNRPSALADMREAVASGSTTATFNMRVLEPGKSQPPRQRKVIPGSPDETIGGIAAHHASLARYPDVDLCLPITDCNDAGYRAGGVVRTGRVSLWHNPGWNLLAIQMGDTVLPVLRTTEGYTDRTHRGIALHDPADRVHDAYGQPDMTMLGREGEFEIYRSERIVFLIDTLRNVQEWFIFDPGSDQ
jgi:tetratricopeptide (TPR) repeat protein